MKRRVQMIHGDYKRDQGSGDQSRKNTGSKKGNTQGYLEIGDETRTRRGQGEDEDEDEDEDEGEDVTGQCGDKMMGW